MPTSNRIRSLKQFVTQCVIRDIVGTVTSVTIYILRLRWNSQHTNKNLKQYVISFSPKGLVGMEIRVSFNMKPSIDNKLMRAFLKVTWESEAQANISRKNLNTICKGTTINEKRIITNHKTINLNHTEMINIEKTEDDN